MTLLIFGIALIAFELKNFMADFIIAHVRKDQARDKKYYDYRQRMNALEPWSEDYRRMFIASLNHPHILYIPGLEYIAYFSIHMSITFGIIISSFESFRKTDQLEALYVMLGCALYAITKCAIDARKTYARPRKTELKEMDNVVQLKKVA